MDLLIALIADALSNALDWLLILLGCLMFAGELSYISWLAMDRKQKGWLAIVYYPCRWIQCGEFCEKRDSAILTILQIAPQILLFPLWILSRIITLPIAHFMEWRLQVSDKDLMLVAMA